MWALSDEKFTVLFTCDGVDAVKGASPPYCQPPILSEGPRAAILMRGRRKTIWPACSAKFRPDTLIGRLTCLIS
jgi:hypothetical protein